MTRYEIEQELDELYKDLNTAYNSDEETACLLFNTDTKAEAIQAITDEIDCSDLSGWLIKSEDISEFETFWRNDEENMPEKFTIDMVVAHWSWAEDDISIDFDYYNSWMTATPVRA